MPITANSPLSSSTANATFMDRTVDTDTIGKLALSNTAPESGDSIVNVQQRVNANTMKVNPSVSLLASESLTIDSVASRQYFRVSGNGTSVTLTTPFSGSPVDGAEIFIVGTSDSLTVTFSVDDVADGLYLNGDATLLRGYMLHLIYDDVLERYFEIGRNF